MGPSNLRTLTHATSLFPVWMKALFQADDHKICWGLSCAYWALAVFTTELIESPISWVSAIWNKILEVISNITIQGATRYAQTNQESSGQQILYNTVPEFGRPRAMLFSQALSLVTFKFAYYLFNLQSTIFGFGTKGCMQSLSRVCLFKDNLQTKGIQM